MKHPLDLRAVPGAFRLTLGVWPLVVRARVALWREPFPAFHARWSVEVERDLRAALAASSHAPTDKAVAPEAVAPEAVAPEEDEPDAFARRVAWECAHAVSRAARLVPRASCLTQALVLQRVLARHGQDCALFLGALRPGAQSSNTPSGGDFEAHAWIEWHGRVLIGGDISRWTPFPLNRPQASPSAPKASAPKASAPKASAPKASAPKAL